VPTVTCKPTPTMPAATATPRPTLTPSPTATRCPGDCDGNRRVTITELIFGVRILLGELRPQGCAALDGDHDGKITIADMVRSVGRAVRGCAAPEHQQQRQQQRRKN